MGTPLKHARLRPCVVASIFVNEQSASEAPRAAFLKSAEDEDDFTAEPLHGAAPGTAAGSVTTATKNGPLQEVAHFSRGVEISTVASHSQSSCVNMGDLPVPAEEP
ncbi:hypothetical protein MRX96_027684 [Rhipicephalus microplus]